MEGTQIINIFYDDKNGVSCKTGELIKYDPHFFEIITAEGKIMLIPVARIIRVESVPQ